MAAVFKLQSFIMIIVCLHSRSSYGFKLPCNGVKIITYGEPCHPSRYMPVTIEVYTTLISYRIVQQLRLLDKSTRVITYIIQLFNLLLDIIKNYFSFYHVQPFESLF